MPKYLCSYAYDVPRYADFTIEATNQKEAEKKIKAALKAGRFQNVDGDEFHTTDGHRVFVQGKISPAEPADAYPDMETLITQSD